MIAGAPPPAATAGPAGAAGLVTLSAAQLQEFYHDEFVTDQFHDFRRLVPVFELLADIGGGVGHFGHAVAAAYGRPVRVIDLDPVSVAAAGSRGLDAVVGDALTTREADRADCASFNLVLHHLVGSTLQGTRQLQLGALRNQAAAGGGRKLFVNEYIYESVLYREFAAKFIYRVTASKLLSAIAAAVSRIVPSLRANTFGTGVRFRSATGWIEMFETAGWKVEAHLKGRDEPIGAARRLLFLLRSCRRDSFLLVRASR